MATGAALGGTGSAHAATSVVFADGSSVEGGQAGNGALHASHGDFRRRRHIQRPLEHLRRPGLVISQNNGFTTGGAAGTSVINLTGILSPLSFSATSTAHLIQYSGAIQGSGFPAFSATLGSTPNVPRGGTYAIVNNSAQGYVDLNYTLNYIYWTGANSQNWVDSGNWNLSTDDSATTYQEADNVLFDDRGAANPVVHLDTTGTSPAVVNPHAVIFSNNNVDYTLVGDAPNVSITNSSGVWNGNSDYLVKTGTGKLTLTNENQFFGVTPFSNATACIIEQGTLAVTQLNVNFEGSMSLVLDGGTLQWIGSGSLQDPSARSTSGGSGLIIAPGVMGILDTNGYDIGFAYAFGNSTGGIDKIGAGTLTLQCSALGTLHETYSGGTTITAGTLAFGVATSDSVNYTGALAGTGPITMNGGTLKWVGFDGFG